VFSRDAQHSCAEIGSRPSQTHPSSRTLTYPWPDYNQVLKEEGEMQNNMDINLCAAWTNERGRSAIHHVTSRRQKSGASIKGDPAKMLTRLIVLDVTSVAQRPDRYGWTPGQALNTCSEWRLLACRSVCAAHYAAWTNQRNLIQVLATVRVACAAEQRPGHPTNSPPGPCAVPNRPGPGHV
jgi:hypothetical protein